MDTTTHHARTHRSPATGGGSGHEAALRWLARQLRWEQTLAELRGEREGDDRPQAA